MYCEAVGLLRDRYGFVGHPYRNPEGHRVCDIQGLIADEHTVLLLAWGSELTKAIEKDRTSSATNGASFDITYGDTDWSETESTLDQDWLSSFLVRWAQSEEHLALERTGGVPEEHALEVLIKRDIPALLSELARLRPDLRVVRKLKSC